MGDGRCDGMPSSATAGGKRHESDENEDAADHERLGDAGAAAPAYSPTASSR